MQTLALKLFNHPPQHTPTSHTVYGLTSKNVEQFRAYLNQSESVRKIDIVTHCGMTLFISSSNHLVAAVLNARFDTSGSTTCNQYFIAEEVVNAPASAVIKLQVNSAVKTTRKLFRHLVKQIACFYDRKKMALPRSKADTTPVQWHTVRLTT